MGIINLFINLKKWNVKCSSDQIIINKIKKIKILIKKIILKININYLVYYFFLIWHSLIFLIAITQLKKNNFNIYLRFSFIS
jgi:hypothetical protein